MKTLGEIESLSKAFAQSREVLAERVRILEDEIQKLKRKHLPGIKRTLASTKASHDALQDAIEESAELFVKPRTYIMHGIKLGYQKGKGGIHYADKARTVKLIEKHFPDQAEVLIKTTKTPINRAVQQLKASDLKRIGATITETGDQVLIKGTDSQLEKMVDALLKDSDDMNSSKAA